MKVFLDTNVMIDLIICRNPFYKNIAQIVDIAEKKKLKLYTSSLSFVNTFYIASKENSNEIVFESLKKFRIICDVTSIDELIVDKSLISDFEDFEDAIQYNSALHHGCDYLITRDEKGFKSSTITVMNPSEFLTYLKNKI